MRHWKAKEIKGRPLVGMVVATYRQTHCLRALVASLQAQTYGRFICLLVHDGPAEEDARACCPSDDTRFRWIETVKRENVFGHNLRQVGFDHLLAEPVTHLCTTNGDGYYAPVYFEAMLHRLQTTGASLVYCDMVHSHVRNGKLWQPMTTAPVRGKIDLGCWMASSQLIREAPWRSLDFAADWEHFSRMLQLAKRTAVAKLEMTLYAHN